MQLYTYEVSLTDESSSTIWIQIHETLILDMKDKSKDSDARFDFLQDSDNFKRIAELRKDPAQSDASKLQLMYISGEPRRNGESNPVKMTAEIDETLVSSSHGGITSEYDMKGLPVIIASTVVHVELLNRLTNQNIFKHLTHPVSKIGKTP